MTVEEMKQQLKEFILEERHFIVKDIYDFMPDADHQSIRNTIKRSGYFLRYSRCPYCNTEILITNRNRQQVYCCTEHKKIYNSKHRLKTRIAVCEYCGEEFATYSFRKTRFCSTWCSAHYREESKKKEREK